MRRVNFLLIICLAFFGNTQINRANVQDSLVVHIDQPVYMSGMNLAWMNFANDLAAFDDELFAERMDSIADAGGNTVRWWLHTNGRHSPIFDENDMVSGIEQEELDNLERALDIAYERGVLLMLCLWSFDMLQDNALEENWERNKLLLEDTDHTQAYIDNALIPMIEAVEEHPGIIAWEIFNEPEGMADDVAWGGWTPETTSMQYIQQFINLTAGAIRRTDATAKVTNGTWNIRTLTDIESDAGYDFYNYYTDERLIAVGGDDDGILDFYQVHYYPEHFPLSESPFHNHVDHWELDKPVVIGEFPSLGIEKGDNSLTTEEAYEFAIENGYAGTLSWTMTGHDGFGGILDSWEAMQNLKDNYPDLIIVEPISGFHYLPHVEEEIPHFLHEIVEEEQNFHIADLNDIFGSRVGDNMELSFEIESNSNESLAVANIDGSDLELTILPDIQGFARIVVLATDTGGKTVVTPLDVSVYDPGSEDLLLNRTAYSYTIENDGHLPNYAVDGDNEETRWSSQYLDNQWLTVQMEEVKEIQRVMLHWEVARGEEYEIQVSENGDDWNTVYYEECGRGNYDRIIFEPVDARYVRMHGIKRATQWGFSLWSFEAYSTTGNNTPPQFVDNYPDQVAHADYLFSETIPLNIVEDPDQGERLFFELSLANDDGLPQWLSFNDCSRTLEGTPSMDDAGEYDLKITVTDMFGESDEEFFTLTVEEEPPTGIIKHDPSFHDMKVFPNPAHDFIEISIKQENLSLIDINIHDLSGKKVLSEKFDNQGNDKFNGKINIGNFLPGTYKLSVTSGENHETIKLIIM